MNYFYDRAFKTGVTVGVILFGVLNLVNYLIAYQKYQEYLNEPVKFAPLAHLRWGFPVNWEGEKLGYFEYGFINLLFAIVLSVVCGFSFKYLGRWLVFRSK